MIRDIKMLPYHIRQAFRSYGRHLAMSLPATIAVSVTLLLLSVSLLLAGNVSLFAGNVESGLQIHAILDADIESAQQLEEAGNVLKKVDNVAVAILSDKDEELELMIKEKGEAFAVYRGEENPLSNAFFITVEDPDQIAQTCEEIRGLDIVSDAVYGGASVSSLISMLDMIRQGGLVIVVLLFFLTGFLITNTIKTTIYARSEEIAIMRSVGASNHFIKVPFEIEGVLIGVGGALLPCIVTVAGYSWFYDMIGGRLFTELFSLQPIWPFTFYVCLGLIGAGVVVGLLGSFVSTTRYLRWKR